MTVHTPVETGQPATQKAILKHRRGSRWMHWINFPLIVIMVWSGLRIFQFLTEAGGDYWGEHGYDWHAGL